MASLCRCPARSDRRLLIVGDSISCGYGNEATRDEGNPPGKENGYMTYGGITARKLGAEVQIIAWSGESSIPTTRWSRSSRGRWPWTRAMKFDPKSWVPGVVLIDLGTNDFGNAKKQPDEAGWINAYKSFIKSIRESAPESYVFVASGPMGTSARMGLVGQDGRRRPRARRRQADRLPAVPRPRTCRETASAATGIRT